jgi:hypothetical protein
MQCFGSPGQVMRAGGGIIFTTKRAKDHEARSKGLAVNAVNTGFFISYLPYSFDFVDISWFMGRK